MISLVLSGGVGSRLWPISREKLPKQFSPLFGSSLFTKTVERQAGIGPVMVCTGRVMQGLTETAIRNDNLNVEEVLYEPFGRNTAPAIAWACLSLQRQNKSQEVLGVFPSDHWVEKQEHFYQALRLAEKCAHQGQIVTMGLKPTYPATGFGYVHCASEEYLGEGELKAFAVKEFKEKPSLDVAKDYIAKGHYYWNSGMFVFKVESMIQAMKEHLPKMWQSMEKLNQDFSNITDVFEAIAPESIDYGVMEKASNQVNVPCDIGWSDLGSWDDVASAMESGKITGKQEILLEQADNCFAYSDNPKTICLSNVENLVVVDTQDALLITQKGQTQSVKSIVEKLKSSNSKLLVDHQYEYRPWGHYRNIYEEQSFKAKVIEVDPHQQLSYQSHTKRAEIWVTVVGEGEVVLNDEIIAVKRGVVVQIPQGAKHRMRNTGEVSLKFVEVQIGDYFGEDDITRYQDDYKRV